MQTTKIIGINTRQRNNKVSYALWHRSNQTIRVLFDCNQARDNEE